MIRLYGHSIGEGSFVQVTRGMKRALEHEKLLAGFVPIDVPLGEYESYEGAEAEISINTGAPFVLHSATMGKHEKRWFMLAPNSETLAPGFVRRFGDEIESVGRVYHGLLTPSAWGAGVLRKHFPDMPVIVCPHGIMPEIHKPEPELRQSMRGFYAQGEFRLMHMTSGRSRRKGTKELIEAFAQAKSAKTIPPAASLLITIEPHFSEVEFWCREQGLTVNTDGVSPGPQSDVYIRCGFGFTQRQVAALYSFSHLVAQPSRGEGFGMICNESRACGVPILMTNCTGHSEHAPRSDGPFVLSEEYAQSCGVVLVNTGPLAPQDDFDNSVGPSLAVAGVRAALESAYKNWLELDAAAFAAADKIREQWAWETVCAPALKEICK